MKIILLILPIFLFCSCEKLVDKDKSNHYYYNWNKTKIIYNDHATWNYRCVVICDLKTFEIIKGLWAKDKYSVFYDGKARPNIDLKTFYFDKNGLPKDKKNVFETEWAGDNDNMLVWEEANPITFELINLPNQTNPIIWGKDDKHYFRELHPFSCDYESFEIICESYSKDKNNVYYENKIVQGADPNTFKYDSLKKVYKDEKFMYSGGIKK